MIRRRSSILFNILTSRENNSSRSIDFSSENCLSTDHETIEPVPYLYIVLNNKHKLDKLINLLISTQGNYCVKIRFCKAVMNYENETKQEESETKRNKICELFINPKSMFFINCPKDRINEIKKDHFKLIEFKNEVFDYLNKDPLIIEKLNILKNSQ